MALGSMAVLGIGSNLSWDVINQMKDQEVKWRIDPITQKIEANMKQQTELTSLMTMMTSLNSSFKTLSDYSTYQQRNTSVEGNGVKATAGEGLAIQDIKINVNQLAQNDVNQLGMQFASRDAVFTNKNTTIDFYHDGTNYSIDVKAGATLSEVSQSITDATGGKVAGIIMKTGGDNPYRLMIQSKDSGKNNKIYFGSTLESAAAPGGKITKGTLEVEIGGKKLSVDLSKIGSDFGNEAKDNAKLMLDAINKELEKPENKDLKDKIDKGEITIDLNNSGKGLLFNDPTGNPIKVKVTDAMVQAADGTSETKTDLGFTKTESSTKDLITGSKSVTGGSLKGTITINGEKIDLSNLGQAGATSEQNAQKIAEEINKNAQLKDKVEAKVENGKLILNSKDGKEIRIGAEGKDDKEKSEILESIGLKSGTFTSSQSFLSEMKIENIQKAQNAEFTYNGIKIERDKNNIDDVVSGLSLELTAVTEKDKEVTVRVSRNDEGISEAMEALVESYNEMYNKIQELVKYDEETEIAGVFNGNSEIRSIVRQINTLITSNDVNGKNLVGYGIYMNEDGTLKFDKSKFDTAYKEDPDAAISFFRSSTSTIKGESVEVDGVFTKLRNTMDGLITGDKSTLKILETKLIDEQKTLDKDKTSTQESIDLRYETMASKWSAYDQLIAKTQQQSQVVTQMIQQSMNS
ncbi:flagellar filament capping protein FliD [Helicobacter winghamensis]|uniref:flagellar filament capping protein FliD n=1 Tax=Helicobacter winghamensis TaxID=157268 RepID=UPI00279B7663